MESFRKELNGVWGGSFHPGFISDILRTFTATAVAGASPRRYLHSAREF